MRKKLIQLFTYFIKKLDNKLIVCEIKDRIIEQGVQSSNIMKQSLIQRKVKKVIIK